MISEKEGRIPSNEEMADAMNLILGTISEKYHDWQGWCATDLLLNCTGMIFASFDLDEDQFKQAIVDFTTRYPFQEYVDNVKIDREKKKK